MKKFLLLQLRPEDETADSEFKAILRTGELDREEVHRLRVERLEDLEIELEDYCAAIAGGSPFDISLPVERKSDDQKQVEAFFENLLDRIVKEDFPFLGACSGSGLLGKYCGTPISGKYAESVGSVTVTVTEAGQYDPLTAGLPPQFTALVGHKEACDKVPDNAVLLLTSEPCPVQMFRIRKNIYATQFHPEADANEFIVRINTYKQFGYFAPETAEDLIASISGTETPFAREILRRFVARYRQHFQ